MLTVREQCVIVCSLVTAASLAASAATERGPTRAPSLKTVLARTADYCVSHGAELSRVIADEHFEQELVSRSDGTVANKRRLDSEIAFVTLAGTDEWLAFRSVLRVDGAIVPDAAGRLERAFRDTPRSALAQASAITRESARFNLGPVERTFNVPTTVLHFLLPSHQERFRFRKVAEERLGGELVWVVEFRERERGTLIRTPDGRSLPARGRIWVAPEVGRVIRSHLAVNAEVEARVDVVWRPEPRLTLWVPAEMRESYRTRDAYDVRGLATYANYRRFEVDSRIVR